MPPRFEPFTGLRYDEEVVPLASAIAPPYDVVDEAQRAELAARSPYNAIHVELPVEDRERALDRYAHAASLFAEWEAAGALRLDDAPMLYIYRMRFVDEAGRPRSSTGVIGALAVDATGSGSVLPHERTMPKPKGDRLDLLRATRTNTSPIWGLSLRTGLTQACLKAIGTLAPSGSATDDEGVVHELWPISDDDSVASICSLIGEAPIVVADGHHRYETATFYRQEQREQNGDKPGGYDLVMALVLELTEDELFVQAIHRLISGLPPGYDLLGALAPFFEISEGPTEVAALAAEMAGRGALGLLWRGHNYFMVPNARTEEQAEAALDSSRLDVALGAIGPHNLEYQHGVRNVSELVGAGHAEAGVLLRPATVAQIADTAHSGRRMPPKTTFFQPKPRTGIVYRPVHL